MLCPLYRNPAVHQHSPRSRIRNGAQVPIGEDTQVDAVRWKIQELLDADVDTAFDVSGFVGTLGEIEERVFFDWLVFCDQSPSIKSQVVFADALGGTKR